MYTKAVNILHTMNPLSSPSLKKLPSEMKHTGTSFPASFTFRPINKRQLTNTSCINFMVKFFKHHSDASDSHFTLSLPPVLLVAASTSHLPLSIKSPNPSVLEEK